jgi:general secretion pathway protein J
MFSECQPKGCNGFTLIEVLVAIAITAVISLGVFQVMTTVIDAKNAIDGKSTLFADLQRLDFIMKRDVTQMISREIIDVSGIRTHAVILDDEGSDYLLEFSRLGWKPSPVSEHKRSAIQRVAYRFEDIESDDCKPARNRVMRGKEEQDPPKGSCFIRYYWTVLDRMSDTTALKQILYDFVGPESEIELVVGLVSSQQNQGVADKDKAEEIRRVKTTNEVRLDTDKTAYVKAVVVKVDIPSLGIFERYWLTPKVEITNADVF